MSYSIRISIPSETLQTSPISGSAVLPPCILDEVHLEFPNGCAGLVGVWFEYQSIQVMPVNVDGLYRGDELFIPIKPNLEISEEDFTLFMYAFNEDDLYEHVITAYINITIQTNKTFEFGNLMNGNNLAPGLLQR